MSESDMRGNVVRWLKELDAVAVENPAYPGTPDVNYISGWLELKWLRTLPAQRGVVRLEHYTPQQKLWLRRRHLRGGKAHLLIQCKREWLLLGFPAFMEVGKMTWVEMVAGAAAYTSEGMTKERLLQWLR